MGTSIDARPPTPTLPHKGERERNSFRPRTAMRKYRCPEGDFATRRRLCYVFLFRGHVHVPPDLFGNSTP